MFSQLRLTPAETARLRQVSYEQQLARGFKRPGYAGLVAERFGDAIPYKTHAYGPSEGGESASDMQKQVGVSSLGENVL